jgi:hypothetical protein
MLVKAQLIYEMLSDGIPVWVTDNDVFHYRNMGSWLLEQRALGLNLDAFVSAYPVSRKNLPLHSWYGRYLRGSNRLLLPNNGVAVFYPSERMVRFARDLLYSNHTVLGWLQVHFNRMLKAAKHHNNYVLYNESNIYLGREQNYNISVALALEIVSPEFPMGISG